MDTANSLLYIGTDPSGGKLVEVSTVALALQLDLGATGSKVRGMCFAQYGSYYDDASAALVSNAPDVTIESCAFVQNAGTGLGIFQPNNVLISNYIGYNGYRGANGNR